MSKKIFKELLILFYSFLTLSIMVKKHITSLLSFKLSYKITSPILIIFYLNEVRKKNFNIYIFFILLILGLLYLVDIFIYSNSFFINKLLINTINIIIACELIFKIIDRSNFSYLKNLFYIFIIFFIIKSIIIHINYYTSFNTFDIFQNIGIQDLNDNRTVADILNILLFLHLINQIKIRNFIYISMPVLALIILHSSRFVFIEYFLILFILLLRNFSFKYLILYLLILFSSFKIFTISEVHDKRNVNLSLNQTLFIDLCNYEKCTNNYNGDKVIELSTNNISALSRIDHIIYGIKKIPKQLIGKGLFESEKNLSLGHTNHSYIIKILLSYGILIIPIITIIYLQIKKNENTIQINCLASIPLIMNFIFNANLSFTAYFVFCTILYYEKNINSY